MSISSKYIVVSKVEEEVKEGFKVVEVQDDFVYKGKVDELPSVPVFLSDKQLAIGDVVMFAKYSPDTHEIGKQKFVAIADLLKVL